MDDQISLIQHYFKRYALSKQRIDSVGSILYLKMNEIYSSEVNHVTHLDVLVNYYIKAFREEKEMIAPEEIYLIFSDVELLFSISTGFLKRLEDIYPSMKMLNLFDFVSLLKFCFLEEIESLKKYANYVNNYDRSLSFMSKLRKKRKGFDDLVKKLEEKDKGWDLMRRMYSPLNRIPQYPLLIKAVLESLDPDSEAYVCVDDILFEMTELVFYIDRKKHNYSQMEKLIEIQSTLEGRMVPNIVSRGRRYICVKRVKVQSAKKYLYMFTDAVMFTKKIEQKMEFDLLIYLHYLSYKHIDKKCIAFKIEGKKNFVIELETKEDTADVIHYLEKSLAKLGPTRPENSVFTSEFVEFDGFLYQKHDFEELWFLHWFILENGKLHAYNNKQSGVILETLDLTKCKYSSNENGFTLISIHKIISFRTESKIKTKTWQSLISSWTLL